MKVSLKNSLALILGVLVGATVNAGVLRLGNLIIPLPNGTSVDTIDDLKKAIPLFETRHFIAPFLAHAIGTCFGSIMAGSIAETHKLKFSLAVGFLFLTGGISMVLQLPSPVWFNVIDLVLAYVPVAFLTGQLVQNRKLKW